MYVFSKRSPHWVWKCCVAIVIITWGSLALYITTHDFAQFYYPSASRAVVQEECLHYGSTCNLRLHFLDELQQYRVSLYKEYGVSTENPVRFLFYTSIYYYQRYMDRWWYLRYDAALRNPFMKAVLWGPGFDNYWDNQTLRENIARVYKSATYFHVINVFLWQKALLEEIVQISNETAVMELHDESWCRPGDDCTMKVGTIEVLNASLVGFAYPSEMLIPEWQAAFARRHVFHIPKTVSAERFYKPPEISEKPLHTLEEAVVAYDSARDIDVLLIGYMHRWIYPIRWKVACMYKSGYFDDLSYKIYHKVHPGYKERTQDEYNITMAEAQIDEYASLMRRSKIVVTDSSHYHYAVGKYAEIPAAGALMLGDIPDEREDDFNMFVARMSHKLSPKEILDNIKYWLEHPIERYLRARKGQIITLQKYTNDHSVDLMVLAYLRFKQNRFGTYFSYPFSDSCKAVEPNASRYCPDHEIGFEVNGYLTPNEGWYIPPNNCTLALNEGTIYPPKNRDSVV